MIIGGTLIDLLWIELIALAVAAGLKLLLRHQKTAEDAATFNSRPRHDRHKQTYDPSTFGAYITQYLFFSLSSVTR
jgi:hypothetical protein